MLKRKSVFITVHEKISLNCRDVPCVLVISFNVSCRQFKKKKYKRGNLGNTGKCWRNR